MQMVEEEQQCTEARRAKDSTVLTVLHDATVAHLQEVHIGMQQSVVLPQRTFLPNSI